MVKFKFQAKTTQKRSLSISVLAPNMQQAFGNGALLTDALQGNGIGHPDQLAGQRRDKGIRGRLGRGEAAVPSERGGDF